MICGVFMMLGCSSNSGVPRVSARGTVKVKGQPLALGSIVLVPAQGNSGPSANGSIVSGAFSIPVAEGPVAGKYRAMISLIPGSKGAPGAETGISSNPSRTKWELDVEIPTTGYENDFLLEDE